MLVDERQLHIEQIDQQSQKIQDLTQKLQDKEQRLVATTNAAKEDGQKVLNLEAELEHRAAKFAQEHEEMTAKLADHESQSRQLRLKLAGLAHKIEEMEENNKVLQKSEEDLQELREKISKGECGNSSLMAELENLRKRVLEMEGRTRKSPKQRIRAKQIVLSFIQTWKREKRVVKDMAGELETVKIRLKELEASESKFEKAEMVFKDDLMKLKSFTVILVDERKNMAERLKQEEQKSDDLSKMFKAEQGKVTEVTEKLIEESKKLLKFKSEMEVKVTSLTKEKDELKTKLASEEEKCRELTNKISGMKIRMDGLEEREREMQRKWANKDGHKNPDEDNKVKELTLEIERLKSRLKQLEVVEGDLMKTEDENEKSDARNKAIEKGEVMSPEAELRIRCKMEEAKTRELQADVQALKEKIHELMNKEDQLSQLQVDYSVLQQRFMEEEEKKKSMSQEVDSLIKELEATRCYSRALRPSMNGRRMVDVPVTSTAVQTDVIASEPAEDETTAGFIRKSVLEENHLMSNLRQRDLKKPTVLERYPPASAELGVRKSWVPWMKKKEAITLTQTAPEKTNGTSLLPPEMTMSPKPGQPLHIRVTPDHENSTATLEITSPRAEDFFSSTTIIPTLGLQKPRITIVPKPTTVSSKSKTCDTTGLDRAKSPVTITTISRAKSPEKTNGSLQSPVSIITVSTTPVAEACASPNPHEVTASRTVIKMTPEKQPGTAPVRKFNTNSNIITTEDNKIHIHLGSQFKRPTDGCSSPMLKLKPLGTSSDIKEATTGTPGSDVQSARSAATRIPVSKGMKPTSKAVVGVSTVARLESRAESQSMKIELRKSTVCGGSASAAAGKS
ncbi:hypothetical protein INR49_018023 [Caranx melampygus]|nr:hypothetical protein INR49_018023 [Caranx melampygus]